MTRFTGVQQTNSVNRVVRMFSIPLHFKGLQTSGCYLPSTCHRGGYSAFGQRFRIKPFVRGGLFWCGVEDTVVRCGEWVQHLGREWGEASGSGQKKPDVWLYGWGVG